MSGKFCSECFGTLLKNGDCPECDDMPVKSKPREKEKHKKVNEVEMFKPEDEGRTWFPVKSPYKDYRGKK